MTTDFFSNLAQIQGNLKLSLTISINTDKNTTTVSILPIASANDDQATQKLKPMNLSGTLEQLDAHFFETLNEPLKCTTKFFHNTAEYLATQKEAEKESKMAKDRKEKIKKLETNLDKLTSAEDYSPTEASGNKALLLAQKIRAVDKDNKKALNIIQGIKQATAQANLF